MAHTHTHTTSGTKQSDSRGIWILLSTILASSMAFIDGTALNVALDAIQRQLGATAAQLLWIVNGYMLTLAAFLLLGGALSAVTFFVPLNLIQAQGYSAALAGVAFLPFSVLLIALSPLMGRLTDRMGPRLPLTVGPAVVALAFALLALPSITSGPRDFWTSFFPGVVALGLGMGITVAPLTTAVMGAVPTNDAGVASAVNNDVTRSAQVLALALLGGVALLTFSLALHGELASLPLSDAARQAVLAGSGQLGHTSIPSGLNPALQTAVRHAIALAFVDMFRVVALIGASLALLSAPLSWLFVQSRPMNIRDSQGAPIPPVSSPASSDA